MYSPFARTVTTIATAVLLGCANAGDTLADDEPPAAPAADPPAQQVMDSLRAAIDDRVGDAAASDLSHCRAIPFGAKPCGGPWSYLVFSAERTDSAAIARLVERYNEAEARLNQEEGRMSDCALVMRPELELDGDHCVAAGQEGTGAGRSR